MAMAVKAKPGVKQAQKKKGHPRDLKPRTRVLVGGFIAGSAILILGAPLMAWVSWQANKAQQACTATVNDLMSALPSAPNGIENTIAKADLARKAAIDTPVCRDAAGRFRRYGMIVPWWYGTALVVVLLSVLPWLRHLIRERYYIR